jgi:hypothetical protein
MDSSETRQVIDVEPGWQALCALDRMRPPQLSAIMRRASFRPVGEWDWVPVAPCQHCLDGGLRVAGTVRSRNAWRIVRVCDTCGAVELSAQPDAPSREI